MKPPGFAGVAPAHPVDHARDTLRIGRTSQSPEVEPEAGAHRTVAEDEREDREREGCRRQHRREADERELDLGRSHEANLSNGWQSPTRPVRMKKALESLG
jgi:hypothetical protein